jgi:hypothetical protein
MGPSTGDGISGHLGAVKVLVEEEPELFLKRVLRDWRPALFALCAPSRVYVDGRV